MHRQVLVDTSQSCKAGSSYMDNFHPGELQTSRWVKFEGCLLLVKNIRGKLSGGNFPRMLSSGALFRWELSGHSMGTHEATLTTKLADCIPSPMAL